MNEWKLQSVSDATEIDDVHFLVITENLKKFRWKQYLM